MQAPLTKEVKEVAFLRDSLDLAMNLFIQTNLFDNSDCWDAHFSSDS